MWCAAFRMVAGFQFFFISMVPKLIWQDVLMRKGSLLTNIMSIVSVTSWYLDKTSIGRACHWSIVTFLRLSFPFRNPMSTPNISLAANKSASLAVKHYMMVGNYLAQGQYVGYPMWIEPYNFMTRQVHKEVCCCCTCIAVNVHGGVPFPDVTQKWGLWNTSTVDWLSRRIQELGIELLLMRNKIWGLSQHQNHYDNPCWGCWNQCFLWNWPQEPCLLHWLVLFLGLLPGLSFGYLDTHNWNGQFFGNWNKSLSHIHDGVLVQQYEQM